MARDWFVFVGPYAEWIRSGADYLTGSGSEQEWERLLDGGVLTWNIGSDSGFPFEHEGQRYRRYCCMPECERPCCPRWPMLFHFNYMALGVEMATSWTAAWTRKVRSTGFGPAFAEELGQAARLMTADPAYRWGLVHWIFP